MAHTEDECSDPRCFIVLAHDEPHAYTREAWEAWRLKKMAENEEARRKRIYEEYKKEHNL